VTSALLQYTDLPAGDETVSFESVVEPDRAILIKAVYRNSAHEAVPVKLPDNSTIDFTPNDTILLLITRKYTRAGIDSFVSDSGLTVLDCDRSTPKQGFGLELMVLKREMSPSVDAATGREMGASLPRER
jgi:hypothetical protein